MKERIIIHYRSATDCDYYLLDEKNGCSDYKLGVSLMICAQYQKACSHPCVLITPMQAVVLYQVDLPKLARRRVIQAIPYALEAQLAQPIEDIHFALCDQSKTQVAVIAKNLLKQLQQDCQQANLQVDRCVPANFLIKPLKQNWQLVIMQGYALLRLDLYQGMVFKSCDLETFLKVKIAEYQQGGLEEPKKIFLRCFDQDCTYDEDALSAKLNCSVKVSHHEPLDCVSYFSIINQMPCNLFQREFCLQTKTTWTKRLWQLSTLLLAILCVLMIITDAGRYFYYRHQVQQLDKQIADIYFRYFPHANRFIAPQLRLQRLRDKRLIFQHDPYLQLFKRVGGVLQTMPEIKINALDYKVSHLTLYLVTSNLSRYQQVVKLLRQHGLEVNERQVKLQANKAVAELMISEAK